MKKKPVLFARRSIQKEETYLLNKNSTKELLSSPLLVGVLLCIVEEI